MSRLIDYCTLIRSKNAGPFVLTFDFMFKDLESLRKVQQAGLLDGSGVHGKPLHPHAPEVFGREGTLHLLGDPRQIFVPWNVQNDLPFLPNLGVNRRFEQRRIGALQRVPGILDVGANLREPRAICCIHLE